MNEFRLLVKCPRCLAINAFQTPYLKCYNCLYVDEKDISFRVNEIEERQRKKVKEIIKFLFTLFNLNIPLVEFPESSLNPDSGDAVWGWANQKTNTIFIPRKTFYLENDELADTIVHEVCHLLSKEKNHIDYWYPFYLQQREKVFKEFSEFVSSTNPQVKFTKGYKVYPDSDEH